MSNPFEILDAAIRAEEKSPRLDFRQRLEKCLTSWQALEFCTFATAFAIRGNEVKEPYFGGELTPTDLFNRLIALPADNEGKWPWNIIREREREGGIKEGIFPPELRNIKSSLPTSIWSSLDALNAAISSDFTEVSNENAIAELSWKWYAEHLAHLGDQIRNDGSNTQHLLYLLGTRREFVRDGGRERDYGLIVGFTEALDNDSLNMARDCVLAAWNLVVVSEHIVEDADRIGALEAARSMSHTFRTFVEASAMPAIRTILQTASTDSSGLIKPVEDCVLEIGQLAAFMGFVARGGIADPDAKIRDCDVQEYDPVALIKDEFEKANSVEATTNISATVCIDNDIRKNKKVPFAHRLYLRAICSELIKNIRDHGKPREDGSTAVKVTIKISADANSLSVALSNPKKAITNPGRTKDTVKGIRSLKGMVEACAGTHQDCEEESDVNLPWRTFITFDLAKWASAATSSASVSTITAEEPARSRSSTFPTESTVLESPGLKILLLDDQLAEPNRAWDSLRNFKSDGWSYYEKSISSKTFKCFGNQVLSIEIILCRSVFHARDCLFDEHFDICLVDVDFKARDLERANHEVPSLGGILPALVLARDEHTYLRVFTAKDSDLRDDANYAYLKELSKKDRLGNLCIQDGGTKEISRQLPEVIYDWMMQILPKRQPTCESCAKLVDALRANNGTLGELVLPKGDAVPNTKIPFSLFYEIISVDRSDSQENITTQERRTNLWLELSKASSGHQVARHTFIGIDHINEATPMCCMEALFAGTECTSHIENVNDGRPSNSKVTTTKAIEFKAHFDSACRVFDVNSEQFRAKVASGQELKLHTRMHLGEVLEGLVKEEGVVGCPLIYGMFEEPGTWKADFRQQIYLHLINNKKAAPPPKKKRLFCWSRKSPSAARSEDAVLSIVANDYDQNGNQLSLQGNTDSTDSRKRTITITGNRTDNGYLYPDESGGFKKTLEATRELKLLTIAPEIRLRGPHGSVDLHTGRFNEDDKIETVCLELTLFHSRGA